MGVGLREVIIYSSVLSVSGYVFVAHLHNTFLVVIVLIADILPGLNVRPKSMCHLRHKWDSYRE